MCTILAELDKFLDQRYPLPKLGSWLWDVRLSTGRCPEKIVTGKTFLLNLCSLSFSATTSRKQRNYFPKMTNTLPNKITICETYRACACSQKNISWPQLFSLYPVDSANGSSNTYPLGRDLSDGYRYPALEQLGPGIYVNRIMQNNTAPTCCKLCLSQLTKLN